MASKKPRTEFEETRTAIYRAFMAECLEATRGNEKEPTSNPWPHLPFYQVLDPGG